MRQLILAACREAEVAEELPKANCRDKSEWDFPIEFLESRVLWDYDWQLADSADLDPDAGQRLKDELGIADDYFVAVPPDPPDAEAERLLQIIIELTDAAQRPDLAALAVAIDLGCDWLSTRRFSDTGFQASPNSFPPFPASVTIGLLGERSKEIYPNLT